MAAFITTYHAGSLAYFDTFAGLVPCKVTRVSEDGNVEFRITDTIGAYKSGEIRTERPRDVVPRKSVRVRSGMFFIRNNYRWK